MLYFSDHTSSHRQKPSHGGLSGVGVRVLLPGEALGEKEKLERRSRQDLREKALVFSGC